MPQQRLRSDGFDRGVRPPPLRRGSFDDKESNRGTREWSDAPSRQQQGDENGGPGQKPRQMTQEKNRLRLEDWFLAVQLLMSWDDRKTNTAESMEQSLKQFMEVDAKKHCTSPRRTSEIFLRGMVRTLFDIDRILRAMNPGDELKGVAKNSTALSILRVLAYDLMWSPGGTVHTAVQGAIDLMERCNLDSKADREWVSEAAKRMRITFEMSHSDWDKKWKAKEEKRSQRQQVSKADEAPTIASSPSAGAASSSAAALLSPDDTGPAGSASEKGKAGCLELEGSDGVAPTKGSGGEKPLAKQPPWTSDALDPGQPKVRKKEALADDDDARDEEHEELAEEEEEEEEERDEEDEEDDDAEEEEHTVEHDEDEEEKREPKANKRREESAEIMAEETRECGVTSEAGEKTHGEVNDHAMDRQTSDKLTGVCTQDRVLSKAWTGNREREGSRENTERERFSQKAYGGEARLAQDEDRQQMDNDVPGGRVADDADDSEEVEG